MYIEPCPGRSVPEGIMSQSCGMRGLLGVSIVNVV